MKKTTITTTVNGLDRQQVAAWLLLKLGPSVAWHHWLMQTARDNSGLHIHGPKLMPRATVKNRPIYDRAEVMTFINDAQLYDPTLRPFTKADLEPQPFEVREDFIRHELPYRMTKATPCKTYPHRKARSLHPH